MLYHVFVYMRLQNFQYLPLRSKARSHNLKHASEWCQLRAWGLGAIAIAPVTASYILRGPEEGPEDLARISV